MQKKLGSLVRCEEQLWPDCGGPSNTFLPPHAVQDTLGLNSSQLPASNTSVTDNHEAVPEGVESARGAVGRLAP